MKSFFFHSLLILLPIYFSSNQSLVDFSYSEFDQKKAKLASSSSQIVITPQKSIIEGYNFPESCSQVRKLEEKRTEHFVGTARPQGDQLIVLLKSKFADLLTISEKIKRKRANLYDLYELSGKSANISIVFNPKDLDYLRDFQQKLRQLNNQIEAKTHQLQLLVQQSVDDYDTNQFKLVAINFQIRSLQLKREYLRKLISSKKPQDANRARQQYQDFFNGLRQKFVYEDRLITQIQSTLKSRSQIESLKESIQALKKNIQVDKLLIQQKIQCVKQRDIIKNKQKQEDRQLKTLMSSLRQKKKQQSEITLKYCEQVAIKLQDRIKKVLLSYNYTFACAQGIQSLRLQLQRNQQQLRRLQQELKDRIGSKGVDFYKTEIQKSILQVQRKRNEASKFSIASYQHDPSKLKQLIDQIQENLRVLLEKKKGLETPRKPYKEIDYKKIQLLIDQIKRMKGTYCQQYERYDARAKQIWMRLQKYESQIEYNSKIRGMYEQQLDQLQRLQEEFEALRFEILKMIQN